MPIYERPFKKDTHIYLENSVIEEFYIVKEGRVLLYREIDEQGETLGPGDIFGVVPAITGRPTLESAMAVSDGSLIVIPVTSVEEIIQKYHAIPMKIITTFSSTLRQLDEEIAKLRGEAIETAGENYEKLFNLGEFYYERQEYEKAYRAYIRYIELSPDGIHVDRAKKQISLIEKFNPDVKVGPDRKDGLEVFYPKGRVVFLEGEPGDTMYIVQSGSVNITKVVNDKETVLVTLKQGELFGEMALLENKPRSASAIAAEDSTLLEVSKDNFELMISSRPAMVVKLLSILADRVWITYRQLAALKIPDPMVRLTQMLYLQILRERVPITYGARVKLKLDRESLMKMAMMDPQDPQDQAVFEEMMSRNSMTLKEDEDGKIVVLSTRDAESLANSFYNAYLRSLRREKQ